MLRCLAECVHREQVPNAANPIVVWHGKNPKHLPSVCKFGLDITKACETDPGFFGAGLYFTQLPNYGEIYIDLKKNRDNIGKEDHDVAIILCWVLLGKPLCVHDGKSYYGKEAEKGYHSHYVWISKDSKHPNYLPVKHGEEPYGDEICVFSSEQCLPRFIVRYRVMKNVFFYPQ